MATKTLFHTRKNKSYTSVILDEISEPAFIVAEKNAKEIKSKGGLAVVKFGESAQKEFFRYHTLKINEVQVGDEIKLLGTTFKVTQEYDPNREGNPLCEVEAYMRKTWGDDDVRQKESWGIFASGESNFAACLIGHCYLNVTGSLIGY